MAALARGHRPAGGPVAFVFSSLLPKTYEAKATLIVGQSLQVANPDINQLLVSQRLSTTYATVATKRPILEAPSRNSPRRDLERTSRGT